MRCWRKRKPFGNQMDSGFHTLKKGKLPTGKSVCEILITFEQGKTDGYSCFT